MQLSKTYQLWRSANQQKLGSNVFAHALRSFAALASNEYDLAVIGGGPGGKTLTIAIFIGYVAAIKGAQKGLKTVCIEKRGTLGGTCINVGCIPSKALLHASHKFQESILGFKELGIKVEDVKLDFKQFMKQKDHTVNGLASGIEHLFKQNDVHYLKGWGRFSGKNEIEVDLLQGGKDKIKAKNIIIATGSTSNFLPGNTIKVDQEKVVTSTGALTLNKIPKRMVVIGAGVIGLEMGSVYQRIGTEVIVIGNTDRICPSMDVELSTAFKKVLDKQGLKFIMRSRVQGGEVTADGVRVDYNNLDGEKGSVMADVVLVATGRHAFTDGLQLDKIGLETDKFGRVETNEHFETKIPGVYAIGDVIKGPMLAHKAEEEGIACVEHIVGEGGHLNYNTIPGVIYTHPEVGSVGKTEEELKTAGTKYKKGVFPFMANSRARTNHESEGFVKILVDAETNKILGVHIIGPNAGEMLASGVLAMEYGASAQDVARTCHAHPTLSEAFKEACMAAYDKPIHF